MSQLGADPEELRGAAASMRRASNTLDQLATGIDRRTRTTAWHGPDARRFRSEWDDRHRPALVRFARDCTHLAGELDRQAREQDRASLDLLAVERSGPDREVRFSGSLELTVASINAALQGELSFEELGDGRVRVGFTKGAGIGVAASVGGSVDFGFGSDAQANLPATGGHAEGKARIGVVERHSWVVEEDEVPWLLGKLAVDHAQGPGALELMDPKLPDTSVGPFGLSWALRTGADLIDETVELATPWESDLEGWAERLSTIPAPERTERLAQVEATVSAGGALGSLLGVGGNLAASGTWRAGAGTTRDTTSLIAEFRGNASGAVGGSLLRRFGLYLPADAHAEVFQRFEYVDGPEGQDQVLLTTSSTVGSELEERTVRIHLDDDAPRSVRSGLRNGIERLTRGDLDGAVQSLGVVHEVVFNADDVEITERSAEVSSSNVRGKANAGAGVSFGISARGRVVEIEGR
jgi:uncharacterized protein YukE